MALGLSHAFVPLSCPPSYIRHRSKKTDHSLGVYKPSLQKASARTKKLRDETYAYITNTYKYTGEFTQVWRSSKFTPPKPTSTHQLRERGKKRHLSSSGTSWQGAPQKREGDAGATGVRWTLSRERQRDLSLSFFHARGRTEPRGDVIPVLSVGHAAIFSAHCQGSRRVVASSLSLYLYVYFVNSRAFDLVAGWSARFHLLRHSAPGESLLGSKAITHGSAAVVQRSRFSLFFVWCCRREREMRDRYTCNNKQCSLYYTCI